MYLTIACNTLPLFIIKFFLHLTSVPGSKLRTLRSLSRLSFPACTPSPSPAEVRLPISRDPSTAVKRPLSLCCPCLHLLWRHCLATAVWLGDSTRPQSQCLPQGHVDKNPESSSPQQMALCKLLPFTHLLSIPQLLPASGYSDPWTGSYHPMISCISVFPSLFPQHPSSLSLPWGTLQIS